MFIVFRNLKIDFFILDVYNLIVKIYNVLLEKIIIFYLFWRFFLDSLSLLVLILKLFINLNLDCMIMSIVICLYIYMFKEMDVKNEISYFY